MAGPLHRESDECQWCKCGKRESRHHLFVECKAWAPQIRRLWRRVAKDCRWKHPKAPAVRKLWKGRATEAVLEFLRDTRIGGWQTSRVKALAEVEAAGSEGEENGPGPP